MPRHPQGHENLHPNARLTDAQRAERAARRDRKIYRQNPDELGAPRKYGWRCRLCPGKPLQGGYTSAEAAAEAFDATHAPTSKHQAAIRERAAVDRVIDAIGGSDG